MNTPLPLPHDQLAAFCRQYAIRKLALFGSVLRDDFDAESDIDILVEFETGHVPGLIRMAALELELTALLGKKADLRTAAELSRYFRQSVVETAQVVYELG